jgi:hypothetical protein
MELTAGPNGSAVILEVSRFVPHIKPRDQTVPPHGDRLAPDPVLLKFSGENLRIVAIQPVHQKRSDLRAAAH